jgi:hypothetical protein
MRRTSSQITCLSTSRSWKVSESQAVSGRTCFGPSFKRRKEISKQLRRNSAIIRLIPRRNCASRRKISERKLRKSVSRWSIA